MYMIELTRSGCLYFFFFNDTATTEIYTLSLHDALPIWRHADALDQSTENDEEPGEGEQSEEEAPKHLGRRVRSLETVGEHGQDGGVERKRRQQAGEPRAECLCQAREPQHEGGRHRHSRRNVPARERRSAPGPSPPRHQ